MDTLPQCVRDLIPLEVQPVLARMLAFDFEVLEGMAKPGGFPTAAIAAQAMLDNMPQAQRDNGYSKIELLRLGVCMYVTLVKQRCTEEMEEQDNPHALMSRLDCAQSAKDALDALRSFAERAAPGMQL